MRALALTDDLSGEVRLYDIDYDAALLNEKIGNAVSEYEDVNRTEIKTHVTGINHFTWFTEIPLRPTRSSLDP